MRQQVWVRLRGDFQVSQGYWSLQVPALETIPNVLGLEKSGKGMFRLIDNYMYMNKDLGEAIGNVLRSPALPSIAREIERGWRAHIGHYLEASNEIDDASLDGVSEEEAFRLLSEWQAANVELLRFHPPSYFTAEALSGALQGFLSGILGEGTLETTHKLLAGFPEEAKEYGVNYHVWEIANVVRQDRDRREIVLGENRTMALAALNDLDEFRQFMKNHGHLGEVDPCFPKLAETPGKVLDMIVHFLTHEVENPSAVYSRQRDVRQQVAEETGAKLEDSQKARFSELLESTQSLYSLYEYEEHSLVRRGLASLRKLLLHLGKRLASAQKIHHVNDVFYLEYEEITRVRDEQKAEQLASMAEKRRKWLEDNRGIPARPVVTEEQAPEQAEAEAEGKAVRGLGASRGVARGPARVVRSADELWKVEKGEVLVAPMTFPEFAPIFYYVRGIVTDEGGICCHAAVIARELGVPAVVGTGNATKLLKNGMLVTLDGTKGTVSFDDPE